MSCHSQNRARRSALLLLVVFAALFSGNTFFVHRHVELDGRTIAHSHPFLPGSAHGHSSLQLVTISELNESLQTMESTATLAVAEPCADWESVFVYSAVSRVDCRSTRLSGRAPPMV